MTPREPNDRTLDDVDSAFRSLVDADTVPGISYGVVSRSGLVRAGGHGVMYGHGPRPGAATVFRIASMTKSFTAAAIMILVERGALNLTDPVSRYVPEFGKVQLPTSDSPQVTIAMLLSMSGGLPTDDAWADRQESMSRDAFGRLLTDGIRFVSTPGTAYEYSNLGFTALGCVIEAASGLGYRDFVDQHLIRPLGMTSTGFDTSAAAADRIATGHTRLDDRWQAVPFSSPGVFSPMAGLFSTVED
ncbi:MAG: serine hydrolase domain-containing protein, partial [Mycobacteriales bacterium]